MREPSFFCVLQAVCRKARRDCQHGRNEEAVRAEDEEALGEPPEDGIAFVRKEDPVGGPEDEVAGHHGHGGEEGAAEGFYFQIDTSNNQSKGKYNMPRGKRTYPILTKKPALGYCGNTGSESYGREKHVFGK